MLTPEDVRRKEFRTAFRGYQEDEVDAFLDEVEAELGRLIAEIGNLRERLAGQAVSAPATAGPLVPSSATEEMLRRTLLLAQQSADETVSSARVEAQRLVDDARSLAAQSLGDLEGRKKALEQQVEALRAFEREYRSRLRGYLEGQLRDLTAVGAPAPPGASSAPQAFPPLGSPPVSAPPPASSLTADQP